MRKIVALMLAVLLLTCSLGANAEDAAYRMAGYDTASGGHDWENHLFFRRMETKTGIAFSFDQTTESYDAWKKHLDAILNDPAAMPDVLFKAQLTPGETQRYYAEGKLIDLKPYLAEHAPNLTALFTAHPEWERAVTLPGGAIAALPGINELQNNNAVWINTAWLKNVRMDMPTTAEELTEVLRAFKKKDPNLNGKNDEIPMTFTSLWDLRFLGHAFGLVSNDYYIRQNDDGSVVFTADSEENRAFIQWLRMLWEEGLIDKNGFATADTTRAITADDATITYGVVFGPSIMSLLPSSQLEKYEVLMPMTYGGKAEYRSFLGDVVRGTFAVTSACKDPAAMVEWVDFLYSEDGGRMIQAGLEGEEYTLHSDGTWSWNDDANTVATTVLTEIAIVGGADVPGYCSAEFQRMYDDEATHRAVEQLYQLKQVSVEPYPLVYLTDAQQARIDAIWAEMAPYMELTQVHFVTGDKPLDDANWAEFVNTLDRMGRSEFVSIWQEAAK